MMIAINRRFTGLAAAAIALAATAPAHAQIAEAETLFREAKRLMKSGHIAEACDKLDASDRLEPTAGTELNLADCREKNGQLATAWAMFLKAAAAAKRADNDGKRAAEARRRAAALEPRLVYLTISVPEDRRVDGLVVTRNGAPIERALWDQRVPVDPGEYSIVGAAPGYEPWTATIVIKTRPRTVELPALTPQPQPPPQHTAPVSQDVAEPAAGHAVELRADAGRDDRASWLTGRRKLSLAIAAVAVGAVGVGLGFGLEAGSHEDQANAICPQAACADPHAVDLNHTARRDALIANIGFVTAGVAITGAGILWFTGSPRSAGPVSIAPVLGADRVGVTLARLF